MNIVISNAGEAQRPILENLFQLYLNEISQWFPKLKLGADGRYPSTQLARYFDEPSRFPWLIEIPDANQAAIAFWQSVLQQFCGSNYHEHRNDGAWAGPLYMFSTDQGNM